MKDHSCIICLHYVDQVNNRDMSIVVLRTFISKCKQEHEANLFKKTRAGQKSSEEKSCELAEEEAPSEPIMVHDDNSNGDLEEVVADDGPSTVSEGPIKASGVKLQQELKPPRVLEVSSFIQ